MIDDFKYKKRDFSRIEIKFTNSLGKILTVWEIENLLERFASLYYKTDLVHTICNIFISGIDLKHLVINNFDFDLTIFPSKQEIKTKSDIEFIYKIGLANPLYHNEYHKDLALIFDFFRTSNRMLDNFHIPTIYIRELTKIIEIYKKKNFESAINEIFEIASNRIKSEKGSQELQKFLNIRLEEIIAERKLYLKRQVDYASQKIFFKKLERLNKPILCFFDNSKDTYSMIGFNHFKNVSQPQSFDVKRISHESPTEVVIILSPELIYGFFAAIGATVALGLKMFHDYNKGKRDKKEFQVISKKEEEQRIIEQHRDRIKSLVNEFSLLSSEYKTVVYENLQKITDKSIRDLLHEVLESIEKEYLVLVNDFSIEILEIKKD